MIGQKTEGTMKAIFVAVTAALLALGACAPTGEMEKASIVEPLLDKRLVSENGTVFIIGSDGSMGGTLNGEAIVGTYEATETEVCSTYSQPAALTGREFCSTPVFDGNKVVFNRRDGSQSQEYTIGG
jgi:hypothetical protein